ncbi:MAG: ATP-binding protein, partial [Mycobacterium sp.]
YGQLPKEVRRVAIVGDHLAPTGSVKPDGTHVHTIWGELAWQLGDAEGYQIVAAADQAATNPGEALHTLIGRYAPAVILIDEWVAYARQLYSQEHSGAGTFDTQFTFAQSLTETVKATPGVLLAISIPASDTTDGAEPSIGTAEEVGGTYGLEALKRLQNVVRRVADQWRPASSSEAYHIVRRRLFVEPDAAALAAIGTTARAFVDMYRKHGQGFPRESRDAAYEQRIKDTYPIHPEMFDRLYEDWSTLERFQRTRGVLRLMNAIIHALWVGGNDTSPLIMPGSIPLAVSAVNAELTQYLQDSWKAIIDADVDGDGSEPVLIDTETPLYGQRSTTRRLARTVFFGAAPTIGTSHKGIETQRVFLGTATPGDVVGNFHSALTRVADRATYFYTGQGKYWYDTQANITRRAKDQAERLHPEDVWAEIINRLQSQNVQRGAFVRVIVCPEDSSDILDVDEATLVIVHPKLAHTKNKDSDALAFAQNATETRGTANRTNRNVVVYVAADAVRLEELDSAIRQYLGWKDVLDHTAELDLTETQKSQAQEQTQRHSDTAAARLLGSYQWLLIPTQADPKAPFTITVTKAEGQAVSLAERASAKLGSEGQLTSALGPATIRFALDNKVPAAWETGHIKVGDLWELFARYPYMTRLRDRSVLDNGLTQPQSLAWQHDGFALADGFDEAAGRYRGLVLPTDNTTVTVTNDTVVVKPAPAQKQRDRDAAEAASVSDTSDEEQGSQSDTQVRAPVVPATRAKTRFFGSKTLNAARYGLDFKKVADEVLTHLAAAPDVDLEIRLEIHAHSPKGFDDTTVQIINENTNALKFDPSTEFE